MIRAQSMAVIGAFALGMSAGAMIAPVMANRSAAESAHAAEPAAIRGAYTVEVLRVIDGDTFEARVLLWPGLAVTTKVRLRGIDAPELKAHCSDERSKAEAARGALAALLAEAGLTVFRVGLDKYGGRVLAEAATARTPDVSQALVRTGLVRSYAGGRRVPWCGP
jgi:endonuclease YncB( thermonuclease family)